MKYKILIFVMLLFILGGCSSSVRYSSKENFKLKHRKLITDKEKRDGEAREGDKLWMVCSFYADKFHGRQTSNGEIFDMHKLTCAHKTLPFNTVLLVSDPDTGKSVKVRVNDRGPFVKGRNLDLSYGAAKQVGLVPYGVKKLQVEILSKP